MTDKKLLARALGFTNNLRGAVNHSTDGAYAVIDLSTARGLIEVLDLMRAEVAALGGERAKVLDLNRQLHAVTQDRVTWQTRWEATDKALGEAIAKRDEYHRIGNLLSDFASDLCEAIEGQLGPDDDSDLLAKVRAYEAHGWRSLVPPTTPEGATT